MSSKKPTRASVKRSLQEIRQNHTTTIFTPPAPAELQEPHQHQQSRKDNNSLPDRISSNHNASLGTERSQEPQAFPSSNKKKYLINLQANGSVIEKDEVKWSTTCGKLIRNHVPIGYDDWRHVDKVYKDSLWTYLMAEFEFNIEPIIARPMLEPKFPQFFRTEKYNLRRIIKDKNGIYFPKTIAVSKCPDDIDKIWWEQFIENEYSLKKIEQRKKNAENKALHTITHTLGRKSYNRVYNDLKKEKSGEPGTRSEAWKRAHISKATGEVHPCAREKYNEIEAAEKRQKLKVSASGQDGVTGIEDLETDLIVEVFGPDTKSRCRAMSSISSAKQVKIKHAAMTISSQNMENPDALRRLDKLENMVSEMFTYLKSTQHGQNQFFGSGTSMTEMCSNSPVHISTSSQNLNPNPASPDVLRNDGPTPGEKQKVILLGREREEVAKGVIALQTICHGRVLQDDEKIVWVDEVLKSEAPIYDGPQNGLSYLCEIADGGFVIWAIKRIRYM